MRQAQHTSRCHCRYAVLAAASISEGSISWTSPFGLSVCTCRRHCRQAAGSSMSTKLPLKGGTRELASAYASRAFSGHAPAQPRPRYCSAAARRLPGMIPACDKHSPSGPHQAARDNGCCRAPLPAALWPPLLGAPRPLSRGPSGHCGGDGLMHGLAHCNLRLPATK